MGAAKPPLCGHSLRMTVRCRTIVRAIRADISVSHGSATPGRDSSRSGDEAATGRCASSVNITFGPFDSRATHGATTGSHTAGPDRCALDTGSAVCNRGSHRALVDVARRSAAPSSGALGARCHSSPSDGAAGRVHTAVSRQTEEAVELSAIHRSTALETTCAEAFAGSATKTGRSKALAGRTAAEVASAVTFSRPAAEAFPVKSAKTTRPKALAGCTSAKATSAEASPVESTKAGSTEAASVEPTKASGKGVCRRN